MVGLADLLEPKCGDWEREFRAERVGEELRDAEDVKIPLSFVELAFEAESDARVVSPPDVLLADFRFSAFFVGDGDLEPDRLPRGI